MAATLTVPQLSPALNSPSPDELVTPRYGVVTLYGYGISVHVDRGHLVINDGIGTPRRRARFSRVGHGLRRLVVIGADGLVSLAAFRWLADQGVSFVMLDRDGSILVTTGPVRPSASRLRRAQAVAHHTGAAMPIVRRLIDQKLSGQHQVARDLLRDSTATAIISASRDALVSADTPFAVQQVEAQAALAYWTAWQGVPTIFPRNDLHRVPDHWRTFGARRSPISGSPRVAVNPPNAILNYLYAMLEAEARFAAAALGLDPGIGLLHVDTDARDSLACDLMEPIRPQVDAYLLQWLMREPIHREWFFEQRNGNCRLMACFAAQLSETAKLWQRAVAPVAEWLARSLSTAAPRSARSERLPTPLTQRHRREAQDQTPSEIPGGNVPPPRICHGCGATVTRADRKHCVRCGAAVAADALAQGSALGREASHHPAAEARRAEALRRNAAAVREWNVADQPVWLTEDAYEARIRPRLVQVPIASIMSALGVSKPYATNVRNGKRRPHPRHWVALCGLVKYSPG